MNIDDRLREASKDVHLAAEHTEDWPLPSRRPRRGLSAVMVGLAVLAVAAPSLFLLGPWTGVEIPPGSVPVAPPVLLPPYVDPPVSGGEDVPQVVLDYWAIEGTLESVGSEPGWLCPTQPSGGYSALLEESDVPAELALEFDGRSPVRSDFSSLGPTCTHSPTLIMAAFSDSGSTTAGVSVWPSKTTFFDTCPVGSCSVAGSEEEGQGDRLQRLTLNDQPATLFSYAGSHSLWWYDPSGVPLFMTASGIEREDAIEFAEQMSVDLATGTAHLPEEHLSSHTSGLRVLVEQPSVGVWFEDVDRTDRYLVDGNEVLVSSRFIASWSSLTQTPLTRHAYNVSASELIDIGGVYALWVGEGGGFLHFESGDGLAVMIEKASREVAVELARLVR